MALYIPSHAKKQGPLIAEIGVGPLEKARGSVRAVAKASATPSGDSKVP